MTQDIQSSKKNSRPALSACFEPERGGGIFELFVVVGLGPHSRSNEPEVLFQFPPDVPLPSAQIPQFCFPQGLTTKSIPLTRSQSKLNSIIYGQLERLEDSENSFIFLLHVNDTLMFGISVLNEELTDSLPSFIPEPRKQPKSSSRLEDITGQSTTSAPRCYCFISRYPLFHLHFSVLYSLLGKERYFHILSSVPHDSKDPNPPIDYGESQHLLIQYFNLNIPEQGHQVTFRLPDNSYLTTRYHGDIGTALIDWCLVPLCKLLSPSQVIALWQAAMREQQIIIVCRNLGVLSALVLSLIPLLQPLVFQGPLIPVLPHEMEECIHAPVPTIVGLPSLPQDLTASETASALILDVNGGRILSRQGSGSGPASGNWNLNLPKAKKLLSSLAPYFQELNPSTAPTNSSPFSIPGNRATIPLTQNINKKKGETSPYKTTEKEIASARKIAETFHSYNRWLLGRIAHNVLKTRPIDETPKIHLPIRFDFVEDVEKLRKKIAKDSELEGGEFVNEFIDTQQFLMHSDELLWQLNHRDELREKQLEDLKAEIELEKTIIETCSEIILQQKTKLASSQMKLNALLSTHHRLIQSSDTLPGLDHW